MELVLYRTLFCSFPSEFYGLSLLFVCLLGDGGMQRFLEPLLSKLLIF